MAQCSRVKCRRPFAQVDEGFLSAFSQTHLVFDQSCEDGKGALTDLDVDLVSKNY